MTPQPPLRIIFAGGGEFGLPSLRAIIDSGHHVVQVFTQPDRPAGRGRKLAPTPIGQFALERNLPLVRTDDINREPLPSADVMVVIAFAQKISDAVANHPRLGSVNLHSSRLPKYRGAAPINWAILSCDKVTGNSIIRLAQRMDAGAVLGMSEIPIGDLDTAGELHDRLAANGAPLLLETLQRLAEGTARETAQDESQATKASKLSRALSKIEWSQPADTVAHQIRGMYPWPGCRVKLVDASGGDLARFTLVRARALTAAGAAPPATVLSDRTVSTGRGAIEIVELQPEGKRAMALAAYRNGHPWEPGMRLESLA